MSIAAFVAAVLVFMPFAVQRTLVRNLPLVAVAVWMSLANIIRGVNSLVWAGSVATRVPVWCDITTKVQIGALYALPAASFCVASKLKSAASRRVTPIVRSEQEEHGSMIFEAAMCVGMPLLAMVLHLVVQNHRFDIIEDVGCIPGASTTVAAMFFWLPALLVGILSLALCCMSWRNVLGPSRGWLQADLEKFDPALNAPLFVSQTAATLMLSCLSIGVLVITVYESSLKPSTFEGSRNRARIDTFRLEDLSETSKRSQFFCWWAMPAAALGFWLWFVALPAAEACDRLYQHFTRRVHRQSSSNETAISLKDLELAKSCPNRLVVRKQSTVEIRVDDYVDPETLEGGIIREEDVDRDKKWTTPWEFASSEERRFSPERNLSFSAPLPPIMPQDAHLVPERVAH